MNRLLDKTEKKEQLPFHEIALAGKRGMKVDVKEAMRMFLME